MKTVKLNEKELLDVNGGTNNDPPFPIGTGPFNPIPEPIIK